MYIPRLSKEEIERRSAELDAKFKDLNPKFGRCGICNVNFHTESEYKSHFDSDQHTNKLAREACYKNAKAYGIDFTQSKE